jgi:hypothetical protein
MKNLIAHYWKKLLYFLITGTTSVFIAACYGMAAGINDIRTWTIKTQNKNTEPIPGLEVTILEFEGNSNTPDTLGIRHTDSTGTISFPLDYSEYNTTIKHKALICDIDSTGNGGFFQDTIITKGSSDNTTIAMRPRQ